MFKIDIIVIKVMNYDNNKYNYNCYFLYYNRFYVKLNMWLMFFYFLCYLMVNKVKIYFIFFFIGFYFYFILL